MHIHFLDSYRPRPSPIHRLDPRVKFISTLAFILATALTPVGAWPAYVLLVSLVLSVEVLSELGVGYVFERALLALPFVLTAVPVLFTVRGVPAVTVPLGSQALTITWAGIERFASIALKSWLSVQMAVVLATSTPFPDLLMAMRAVRLPRLMVAIVGLAWRYLFVMADEALRLMRARASRSGALEGRGGDRLFWCARVTGGMAGTLFLRSFERADRIYAAMLSRGYDGEVRTLGLPALRTRDILIVLFFALLLAAIQILARLFW
jgi:cobalt/nickel transport system permease protein